VGKEITRGPAAFAIEDAAVEIDKTSVLLLFYELHALAACCANCRSWSRAVRQFARLNTRHPYFPSTRRNITRQRPQT